LYGEDGALRLAPFYDLLSTAIYPQLDTRLAMSLGGKRQPEQLRRKHWELFADELGVAPRAVLGELERLTRRIEPAAAALAADFTVRYQCPETMAAILEIIRRRAGRAWTFLGGRPE
jgi:serine/threonine-protein kinase HipA